MFVKFDPRKHKGFPLFELQGTRIGTMLADALVPSTATYEQASKAPWHYSVEVPDTGIIASKAVDGMRTMTVRAIPNIPIGAKAQHISFCRDGDGADSVNTAADKPSKTLRTKRRVKVGLKGGPGSGFYGHAGIPGHIGGSAPGSGRRATPMGLGSHDVTIDQLSDQLPDSIANDIQEAHSSLGESTPIQYHVVSDGYTMTPSADSPMAFYRSLRKISSIHEGMAADTTVSKRLAELTDQTAANAIGKNKLMISAGVSPKDVSKSAAHIVRSTIAGAFVGAAEEVGRQALTELRASIRRGDADPIGNFIKTVVTGMDRKSPTYRDLMDMKAELTNVSKYIDIKKDSVIRKAIDDTVDQLTGSRSAKTAARKIWNEAKPKLIRRAVTGAISGAVGGAAIGRATLTGRGGPVHKYILKQLRLGGQVTMGRGTWAMLLEKTDAGHRVHVYGVD